jgi:rhodanese-related sulfurtransferase
MTANPNNVYKGVNSLRDYYNPEIQPALLDLRTAEDFATFNLSASTSISLQTLSPQTKNPFRDATTLEKQWTELNAIFAADSARLSELHGKHVYVLCYDGDTSRVATSILRARGVEASSLRGGLHELQKRLPEPQS